MMIFQWFLLNHIGLMLEGGFLKNRIALLGALILGIIVFMCAAAPLFTQYDPVKDMVFGRYVASSWHSRTYIGNG